MNQIRKGSSIEPKLFFRYRRNQLGAGFVIRFIEHVLSAVLPELLRVGGSKERALVMIEPPRHLWRIGILEIHDDVFVSVEDAVLPRLCRPVGHAGKFKFGVPVKFLKEKAVEESSGGRAVKAAIVETKPDLCHLGFICSYLHTVLKRRGSKANQDVCPRQDCQGETPNG